MAFWRKEYCPKHPSIERGFCTRCSAGTPESGIPSGVFRNGKRVSPSALRPPTHKKPRKR